MVCHCLICISDSCGVSSFSCVSRPFMFSLCELSVTNFIGFLSSPMIPQWWLRRVSYGVDFMINYQFITSSYLVGICEDGNL